MPKLTRCIYLIPVNHSEIYQLKLVVNDDVSSHQLVAISLFFKDANAAKNYVDISQIKDWIVQNNILTLAFVFNAKNLGVVFDTLQVTELEKLFFLHPGWKECQLKAQVEIMQLPISDQILEAVIREIPIHDQVKHADLMLINALKKALHDYIYSFLVEVSVGAFGFNRLILLPGQHLKLDYSNPEVMIEGKKFSIAYSKTLMLKSVDIDSASDAITFLVQLKQVGFITELQFEIYEEQLKTVSYQSKLEMVARGGAGYSLFMFPRNDNEMVELAKSLGNTVSLMTNFNPETGQPINYFMGVSPGEPEYIVKVNLIKQAMLRNKFLAQEHENIFLNFAFDSPLFNTIVFTQKEPADNSNHKKRKKEQYLDMPRAASSNSPRFFTLGLLPVGAFNEVNNLLNNNIEVVSKTPVVRNESLWQLRSEDTDATFFMNYSKQVPSPVHITRIIFTINKMVATGKICVHFLQAKNISYKKIKQRIDQLNKYNFVQHHELVTEFPTVSKNSYFTIEGNLAEIIKFKDKIIEFVESLEGQLTQNMKAEITENFSLSKLSSNNMTYII